jgi:hypothetical protein
MVLQDVERRPPIVAVGDDLAVDDAIVRECFERTRDRSETLGEVFAVARAESDLAVGLQTERSIAVELQLVRPSRPFRQFGNRRASIGSMNSTLALAILTIRA